MIFELFDIMIDHEKIECQKQVQKDMVYLSGISFYEQIWCHKILIDINSQKYTVLRVLKIKYL